MRQQFLRAKKYRPFHPKGHVFPQQAVNKNVINSIRKLLFDDKFPCSRNPSGIIGVIGSPSSSNLISITGAESLNTNLTLKQTSLCFCYLLKYKSVNLSVTTGRGKVTTLENGSLGSNIDIWLKSILNTSTSLSEASWGVV